MKILCLGDVVSRSGVEAVYKKLPGLMNRFATDAVIVNGENAAMGNGNGITREDAEMLFEAGADVITGGNHSFRQKNIYELLESSQRLLRPANYSSQAPGKGYTILPVSGRNMLVINVAGRVNMEPCDCPFTACEKILKSEKGKYDFAVVDFHAEATSEKIALAYDLKDDVSVFFGTHTHVATADEQILEGGCGYITDIGMCGPDRSALGLKTEIIIRKLRTGMPVKFEPSTNPSVIRGALFTLDKDLKCVKVERVLD